MDELHQNEQYFFTQRTIEDVADLLEPFERPCVLCAPMVGVELERRGADVATLDIDERFVSLRGFFHWDITRPLHMDLRFGVIFCDPPFFNVSLSQLFHALRMLAHFDFTQPVAMSYLSRRRDALLSTFAPFGVQPTNIMLEYRTVQKGRKNDIELFSNIPIPEIST